MHQKNVYAKPEVKILTDFGLADISKVDLEKVNIHGICSGGPCK